MNDRFKFRVWDKELKQYVDNNFFLTLNGELGFHIKDSYPHWRKFDNTNWFVLEQCTGIKDRNGKLIYEGDLIRLVVDGKVKNQGVIEWCNARGDWAGAWQATDYCPNGTRYPKTVIFSNWWEIYGNVHEMEIEK
jgi:uncharacterized phage protein (TIGR01671 family)